MATTTILNDLIDLNQTGNTTALKGCVGTNAQQPADPTISVQYLVVGGGGAAGGGSSGGGGAGGLSTGTIAVPNNTAVNIVVGQGGLATTYSASSQPNGQDSGFYTIQGQGGGAGRYRNTGQPGGSGGGGGNDNPAVLIAGGSGVSGQGNNGGSSTTLQTYVTGGGGGAGSVGGNAGSGTSGDGGVGSTTTIISTTNANASNANVGEQNGGNLYFAGGGGGGGSFNGTGLKGDGGLGGGGDGSQADGVVGGSGTPNTGGGAGGGHLGAVDSMGGNGGSGVVILRYANTATETIAGSLAGGITTGTTTDCNYPTTSNGLALYQFSSDATDTCGNYDGTNDSGITYSSPGVFGNGAQFGGGSDRIDINQAILGSGTTKIWSTSFWFLTSSTAEQYLNNSAAAGAFTGFGIFISPTNGYLRFQTSNGSGSFSPYLSLEDRSVQDGNWHHVVATYSSAGGTNDAYMYLYLDGQNVTDLCTAGGSWTQGGGATWSSFTIPRISLGNWADSSTYPSGLFPLIGSMDQVRFFDVALTADQVAMLYAENIGATKFTESSDTVLVFKAGSGTINLTDTSIPGPKIGDLRTNTDQSSANSASAMEHYMSTGWRVFNNCTTSACNYPTTASALYQLNDNANDTCGNSNGTFTNPSYVTGKFGNAASFNGSNNYIEVPLADTPSLLVSTVTFWVKTTTTSADGIIGVGLSSSGYWQSFQAYCYGGGLGGALVVRYGNGTAEGPAISSTSSIDTGEWVFCAVTMSGSTVGSTIKLYVNGVLETTHTTTVSRTDSTSKGLVMGAYYAGNTSQFQNWFTGTVDQARIFPSVLTASQITELYNETSC